MERHGPIGLSEEQIELLESARKYCRDKSGIETVRHLIDDELGAVGELGDTAPGFAQISPHRHQERVVLVVEAARSEQSRDRGTEFRDQTRLVPALGRS